MASSKTEKGMWTCTAGALRNFERLLGRRFSAEDIGMADDEAILAAHKAFRISLESRGKIQLGEVGGRRLHSAVSSNFLTPLFDTDVPAEHQITLAKYRKLAAEHKVAKNIPLCYRVRAGFTLKQSAPQIGRCYEKFRYLQGWNFDDKPTKDGLVFWIPQLVNGGNLKTTDEQRLLLADLRRKLELSEYHFSGFGEVSLVAGLILAHFKATEKRIPLEQVFVRTDTRCADGSRLTLGDFGESGLYCGRWCMDDARHLDLSVFALGVEFES